MSLADLNISKVYCYYFDRGNLQVIDMEEDLKITIMGHLMKLIYIYESRGKVYSIYYNSSEW